MGMKEKELEDQDLVCLFTRVRGFGCLELQRQELISLMESIHLSFDNTQLLQHPCFSLIDDKEDYIELDLSSVACLFLFPKQKKRTLKMKYILDRATLSKQTFIVKSINQYTKETYQGSIHANEMQNHKPKSSLAKINQGIIHNEKQIQWSSSIMLLSPYKLDQRDLRRKNIGKSECREEERKCRIYYLFESMPWLEKSIKYLDYFDSVRREKLGPTSLPTMHTLLALNLVKWGLSCQYADDSNVKEKNSVESAKKFHSVLLDPFSGSGTTLRLALSVIDLYRKPKTNIKKSTDSVPVLLLGSDIHPINVLNPLKSSFQESLLVNVTDDQTWRKGIADAVVTDLPYNIRTAAFVPEQTSEPGSVIHDENLRRNEMEKIHSIFFCSLKLAEHVLAPGSRIAFWYIDLGDDGNNALKKDALSWIEKNTKHDHPIKETALKFICYFSDQKLPLKRCIWLFEKTERRITMNNHFVPGANEGKYSSSTLNMRPLASPRRLSFSSSSSCSFEDNAFLRSHFVSTFQERYTDPAGPGSLFELIRKGDLGAVQAYYHKQFMQRDSKPNSTNTSEPRIPSIQTLKDKKGKGVLAYAAGYNQVHLVEYLVKECGMNVNACDALCQQTPIFYAARWGHGKTVEMLIDLGADLFHVDKDEHTIFSLVAGFGHASVLKILLEAVNSFVGCSDKERNTATAWISHDKTRLKLLEDALFQACKYNHNECVELILDKILLLNTPQEGTEDNQVGVFVNALNIFAFRSIMSRCLLEIFKWGHLSLLTCLISDYKIQFTKDNLEWFVDEKTGNTILHEAAYFSRIYMIEYFKLNFADVFEQYLKYENKDKRLPLDMTVNKNIQNLLSGSLKR